jgi:hypothetical protein
MWATRERIRFFIPKECAIGEAEGSGRRHARALASIFGVDVLSDGNGGWLVDVIPQQGSTQEVVAHPVTVQTKTSNPKGLLDELDEWFKRVDLYEHIVPAKSDLIPDGKAILTKYRAVEEAEVSSSAKSTVEPQSSGESETPEVAQ